MIICIFEDKFFSNFYPLTYNRHISELFCGTLRIKDRIKYFYPEEKIVFWGREYLKDFFLKKYPGSLYNIPLDDDTIFINARTLVKEKTEDFFLEKEKARNLSYKDFIKGKVKFEESKKNQKIFYTWDLLQKNEEFIKIDFENFYREKAKGEIFIGKNVDLSEKTSIDTSEGPVIIEDEVIVEPFVYIKGPVFIGKKSKIKANSSIYGATSFEYFDKVSGEISSSIFLSFSNKQHHGFVGNSYIGSFVNLGAGTTTSNLKNTYSNIKVELNGEIVNTGLRFLGTIIGDYSRTGIGTYLNTGTTIGFGTQIMGEKKEKFFPSFIFEKKGYSEYEIEKEFATIKVMKERRGEEFFEEERKIILEIFKMTENERKKFLK